MGLRDVAIQLGTNEGIQLGDSSGNPPAREPLDFHTFDLSTPCNGTSCHEFSHSQKKPGQLVSYFLKIEYFYTILSCYSTILYILYSYFILLTYTSYTTLYYFILLISLLRPLLHCPPLRNRGFSGCRVNTFSHISGVCLNCFWPGKTHAAEG